MGAVNVTTDCLDGTQQSTISATNGNTTVTIDGLAVPADENGLHTLAVEPGEHIIVWLGPSSHDPELIIEWNRTTVEVPVLDCTPTTSQASPTTSEVTTSTPASTLPPTSMPATTAPPTTWAIDTPQTAVTVATTGVARELPATGDDPTALIVGGVLFCAGLALHLVRRRPA